MNKISQEDKKIVAKLAYKWCLTNLKRSKYKKEEPKIIIRKSKNKNYKGYYSQEKNLMVIFIDNHNCILDLCETVIHEWKHYQQNIEKMYNKYIKVYRRNFKNHPYEVTAERFSKKHGANCKKWVNSVMEDK